MKSSEREETGDAKEEGLEPRQVRSLVPMGAALLLLFATFFTFARVESGGKALYEGTGLGLVAGKWVEPGSGGLEGVKRLFGGGSKGDETVKKALVALPELALVPIAALAALFLSIQVFRGQFVADMAKGLVAVGGILAILLVLEFVAGFRQDLKAIALKSGRTGLSAGPAMGYWIALVSGVAIAAGGWMTLPAREKERP